MPVHCEVSEGNACSVLDRGELDIYLTDSLRLKTIKRTRDHFCLQGW